MVYQLPGYLVINHKWAAQHVTTSWIVVKLYHNLNILPCNQTIVSWYCLLQAMDVIEHIWRETLILLSFLTLLTIFFISQMTKNVSRFEGWNATSVRSCEILGFHRLLRSKGPTLPENILVPPEKRDPQLKLWSTFPGQPPCLRIQTNDISSSGREDSAGKWSHCMPLPTDSHLCPYIATSPVPFGEM